MTNAPEWQPPDELFFYDDWLKHTTKSKILIGNNKYIHADIVDALLARAEAKLAEAEERIEELASACEVVSSEFEGDLWKACRRILQETDFDFDHHEGVQVSAFEDHMREVLATREDILEEAARDALESTPQAVRVRPLRWNGTTTGWPVCAPCPSYRVSKQSSSPEVWYWGADGEGWAGSCVSYEAAKAAAQDDYSARIMSSLEPALAEVNGTQ